MERPTHFTRFSRLGGWLCFLFLLLTACSTSHRAPRTVTAAEEEPSLSYEEERRFQTLFLEANRANQQNDYATAYELYQQCLEINPRSAAVLYELAQYNLYLNRTEEAEAQLNRAIALAPDNIWYKKMTAAYYRQSGNIDRAIALNEDIAEQFPKQSDALMNLIDLYNRQRNYEQVIHTLDRLEVKEGKSEQLSMEKYRMYLQVDNKKKAFEEIENLAKEYPNDLRYRVILGDAYMDNDDLPQAHSCFRSVLQEEPDNVAAQLSLATYYERMGQDSLYRNQLDTVLLNRKLDTEMRLNMMRRLIVSSEQSQQDSTKLLTFFRYMMNEEEENADISMLCAQYMISKKMPVEEVKPVLNHILDIEPDNTAARIQLLGYAIDSLDYQEAVNICIPAIEYNPDVLEFYYYLGLSYYQLEQKSEALQTFQKGLEQVTEESDKKLVSQFYEISGDLYHQTGRNEEAYAAYDSALVYDANNIGALNNYAYYLSEENRELDKAEEMSYRTVKAEPHNDTYLDTYAWILFMKGRYTEARLYMDEAMKNGGEESAVLLEHCGDIYYHCGEVDQALAYWQRAAAMEHESKTLEKKIKLKKYIAE
jgi:tetratricopeptide (TPR) repeat protein